MPSSNIYNILSKLNALQPKAAEPKDQVTKPIYESVEARGSIMSGVNRLEKKLSEQFAADKKALDTNPKNAAWDADALVKHKARLSREKKNIGMQRKVSGMDTGLPPAVQESLIDDDSTDIRELLNFNLFRDYQSFKDGDIDPESYGPEEIQAWEKLFSAWGPIAVQLERQINKAAASGAALTPEQNQLINDNWYDGSDAYDDPLRELPGIYGREIPIIRKILRQSARVKEGMAEDAATVKYGVFSKGGSIGSQRFKDEPLKTFDSKEEAIADAKRRRSGLSKGERGYYRMGYVVKAIKDVTEGSNEMDKVTTSPYKANQMLGGKYPVAFVIEVLCPDQSVVNMIQNKVGTAYQVERDDSIEGNGIGIEIISQRFDGGQAAQAAYNQLLNFIEQSGGQFNSSTQVTIYKQKPGVAEDKVEEGWDDMIKAGKERDAADRSGKKSTTSGVKHHGKYGTEYQGDADEEEAAAKAADKGPKKRGRPAKGQAKPKPATGEKKGRGRPKKAAEPTYSGAKDLQNYIVGNLPKGKQAKGKVHKIDEGRMLDEAGQHLDHILNRFKHEVRNFEETGDLDQDSDLYHALHDYYKETGLLPYNIEKGRGAVSTLTWVADQLDQHLGISEEAIAPATTPAPAAPASTPLGMPGTGGYKAGDKVMANGQPATMVGQVPSPAGQARYYNVTIDGKQYAPGTSDMVHSNQVAPMSAAPAPAMESELNELAKLAGLTIEAKVKPDYIDLDKDGNKKEPMSQAAQDAEDDDHDYANRLDDEQMDENIPVHKPVEPNRWAMDTPPDDDEEVCPECDGEGCPECYGDEHRDRAHDHARGMERESAIREAQEMINFMRNAGLDTSRAESALAEAYKYGDTDVEEAPEYANSPDEEIENVEAVTRQGNDLNREKKQFAGKPKAGDNPMASESSDPLEAMGRRLMRAYESIKVVDEGMVDKVKGMFGKVKKVDGPGNLFNEPDVKADTRSYLKKSAKQPNGPDNVKNIFNK